ncbi:MAG TPA: hypothetical protein VF120_14310 [Ktedonobacterales bacterium]
MNRLTACLARLLFGYTTAERAEIQRRYIDWRIEQVIVGSLERLTAEDEAEDQAQHDAAQEGEAHP